MMLSDKLGISCDICRTAFRYEFVYYSIDFNRVKVQNNTRPAEDHKIDLSVDVCEACWVPIAETIVRCYRAVYQGIVCDLSGILMFGNFEYFSGRVDKVLVKTVGKAMSTLVDEKFVEISVSPMVFAAFRDKVAESRKVVSEWSSTVDYQEKSSRSR